MPFVGAVVKLSALLLAFSGAVAEQSTVTVELRSETHHKLLLENENVRAYLLELKPGEVTQPHRHSGYYAVAAIAPVAVANEVRGREPIRSEIPVGEITTSKGGFVLAERNVGVDPLVAIVLEFPHFSNEPAIHFELPTESYKQHHAATGLLLEGSNVRIYSERLAAGGYTEPREQRYDQLLVPIEDIRLKFESRARGKQTLQLKRGEILFIEKGPGQSFLNAGAAPAQYFVVEFR